MKYASVYPGLLLFGAPPDGKKVINFGESFPKGFYETTDANEINFIESHPKYGIDIFQNAVPGYTPPENQPYIPKDGVILYTEDGTPVAFTQDGRLMIDISSITVSNLDVTDRQDRQLGSVTLNGRTASNDPIAARLTPDGANWASDTYPIPAKILADFDTIRPMIGATKTATSVASEVFAGASRKTNRRGIMLKNEHRSIRMRIDGPAITAKTGIAMEPFSVVVITFDPAVDVPVYVISEAGNISYGVVEW